MPPEELSLPNRTIEHDRGAGSIGKAIMEFLS